ncbi:MAG: malonyl-CoA synthase [Pseudomonadota bacterium]
MPDDSFNLYGRFAQSFAGAEDKVVLRESDGTALTFADLDRRSAHLAAALSDLGVSMGDRVTVQVRKSPENLALYFACLRAGFVYHPLNMGYKKAELEYFIGNAEPAIIVCDAANEASIREVANSAGVERLHTVNVDRPGSLSSLADRAATQFETVASNRDDLAALLYSSGTTGVPKGIMLTHGNLLANTETLVDAWGFSERDTLLHALPIFHVHGLFVAIGCAMLSRASMVWFEAYDARQALDALADCTIMMGVPTYYTRLLAEPELSADACRNMRLFISGSAPLLEETFVEFEQRTEHRILERYGMTETNMNTSNPLNGERKPGTVGPPLPGVEARVVDDDGAVLAQNQNGNLQVRGNNVFIGYWRMPDKTAEDFTDDGYFNTGDIANIDDDGYVSIVGRAKDLVITGGLNVYPKEIELFIDDLPGVRESAVIGVPHADFGEGVVAVVVREGDEATEEGVRAACKASLADFKVPKKIIFIKELPRNTMAKVQKNLLRDRYADMFTEV